MRELWLFQTWDADFFSDLDGTCMVLYENMPIETYNISFESTQNKQQYGTKIIYTKVKWEGGYGELKFIKNYIYIFLVGLTSSPP